MKILLLASQHGDELLGEKLYDYIKEYRPELLVYIEFVIANPIAHAEHVRFIESDMNRSYVDIPKTTEEIQAKEILAYIQKGKFDLVLDLHTTRCIQPPCLIIKDYMMTNKAFIDATNTQHVVVMSHEIVDRSLIGKVNTAVSIEVSDGDLGNDIYKQLANDIDRYISKQVSAKIKKFYKVIGLLNKNEIRPKDVSSLINFQMSSYGFYPVLVGENSYKKNTDYLGFKTIRIPIIKRGAKV